ncbi:hypothetical protein BASA50_000571 [Batrachochytrium salamandrivorans]|uniref:Uncharacterized protein n=1 Tax=Batrachochytrium salamandrivorans TaxID=1357716 RepID=A0ABQ8ETS0_9FUNG|nr:hypothetical protein BASA62_005140 [Batrachochytrium salamandrivorans]KAH6572473.1 hypothetical protein BASA60_006600 [Batrachochytrium salamandrivorans]KAH6581204.1 hypothetical protein BASA61_009189 [Batrachochytrium salamandrivorans]KAH6586398.1 hypothetical protein BASA50_000571 [Batrachochytrium salamandrivorans]
MKLSGFFVAAIVITSANAGWPDKAEGGDTNPQATEPLVTESVTSSLEPSLSSASHAMSSRLKQQIKDYSIIKPLFTMNEGKNDMLIKMFKIKEEIFNLVAQVELESFKYHTTMKLASPFAPTELIEPISSGGPNYLNVKKLLGKIDRRLEKLKSLDYKYVLFYNPSRNAGFLGFDNLRTLANTVKSNLDLLKYQSESH